MRSTEEKSTIETQCPRCMSKLNGSCRGDYEGCVTFKPKRRIRPSKPQITESKQLIEKLRPGKTLKSNRVIELVRMRCNGCGAKGPFASTPEKAVALAGKEGWNIYLGCCKTCNKAYLRSLQILDEDKDVLEV